MPPATTDEFTAMTIVGAIMPGPDNPMTSGLLGAFDVMTIVSERLPANAGLNWAVMLHEAAGASVGGQLLPPEKFALAGTETELMLSVAVPELVSVTVCNADGAEPVSWA